MKKLSPLNCPKNNHSKSPVNRTNKNWTPEEEKQLWEYYRKGYSYKGVAVLMGRTSNSISAKILEIKTKKRRMMLQKMFI